MAFNDSLLWCPHVRVLKYQPGTVQQARALLGREPVQADFELLGILPDEITEAHGNLLTTAGLTRITGLIIGNGEQAFTNARAVVGVGTSTTAATAGDTALGNDGTANARYRGADSSNPSRSGAVITCNSTFGSGEAEFAWNEWCLGIATAAITAGNTFSTVSGSGVLLNRKVQSLGTKGAGSTWTLQATITLSSS